jgi:hypothetical protein
MVASAGAASLRRASVRARVKIRFRFMPPARKIPGATAKSAKFHICSPTTASILSKTRWEISSS